MFALRPFRYLDEWPYVGLNMSRSLGDSKLHAVGVSDVPDVTSIFLEDGPSPQPLGVGGLVVNLPPPNVPPPEIRPY